MREIALHLVDIAENSVAADSKNITIEIHEDLHQDILSACVTDDGHGMDAETAQKVQDPFYTTRTTRNVGLGIPLVKLAAELAEGRFSLLSEPGSGTRVEAVFRHSHIDRMPLGDLSSTFLTGLVSYPKVHWTFVYRVTDAGGTCRDFVFDDTDLKIELGDLSLTEPEVLAFVRGLIEDGIDALSLRTVV